MRLGIIIVTNREGLSSVVAGPNSDIKGQRRQFKDLGRETKDGGDVVCIERWDSTNGRVGRKKFVAGPAKEAPKRRPKPASAD